MGSWRQKKKISIRLSSLLNKYSPCRDYPLGLAKPGFKVQRRQWHRPLCVVTFDFAGLLVAIKRRAPGIYRFPDYVVKRVLAVSNSATDKIPCRKRLKGSRIIALTRTV